MPPAGSDLIRGTASTSAVDILIDVVAIRVDTVDLVRRARVTKAENAFRRTGNRWVIIPTRKCERVSANRDVSAHPIIRSIFPDF